MSIESAEATAALVDHLTKSLSFADISTTRIADELGITTSTVDSWLKGTTSSRMPHLMVWARVCGVPFEWLTGTEQVGGPSGRS